MLASKVNKISIDKANVKVLRLYAKSQGISKIQKLDGSTDRFGVARREDLLRNLEQQGYTEIPEDFILACKEKSKKPVAPQELIEEQSTVVVEEITQQFESTTDIEEINQPVDNVESEQEQPAITVIDQPAIEVQPITFETTKEENILDILQLNPSEQAEVYAAIKAINVPLNQLIKDGLLMKARKVNTEAQKLANMTIEQRKQTTMAGAAIANLRLTTDAIVAWNHSQYDNGLRIYINASILRTLTGSNLNTIKDFLSGYRTNDEFIELADEHNARYELTESDNRKGRDEFGNRIKIADLIKNSYASPEPRQYNQVAVVIPVQEQEERLSVEAIALLSPEDFAKAVDGLPEVEVKALCEAKMDALRKENEGKSVHTLKKLITAHRKAIEALPLTTHNTYQHTYDSPRTVGAKGWTPPSGSVLTEDETKAISEPRHLALKYIKTNEQEQQEAKHGKSEN